MQTTIRSLGAVLTIALLVASQSACKSITPVETGKLEVALSLVDPTADVHFVAPPGAPPNTGLTIRTTGWKLSSLLFGRCSGNCDDAPVDAWLIPRTDALYGLEYGCPADGPCVHHSKAWGFEAALYGTCPTNVNSMLQPVVLDPHLGVVDTTGVSTSCNATAPTLVEGATYYVAGEGLACEGDSLDACHEINGVRFFRMESGKLVDVAGTSDDRRPVHFPPGTP